MRVLHLIPEFVFLNTFHGSYKDVLFRIQWLERNAPGHRQLRVRQDDLAELEQVLSEFCPTHVLIEYTRFPKITRAVRAALPDAWIGVRAHNIEPLQHLDNHGWWPKRGPLWMVYGMFRLWRQDVAAKRIANVVLSINEWENRIYWNRLLGRARVEWLPYVCPAHLLSEKAIPYQQRVRIACLPTSKENRKSRDLVLRFQQLASEMTRRGTRDEFVITGDLSTWDLPECPEVTYTGFVENLSEFMGTCKVICMLSPLGYGFKTTIADAFATGSHVLAHPELIRRSPNAINKFLIPCDSNCSKSIDSVVRKLRVEPCGINVHRELCKRADHMMYKWFEEKPI